MTLISWGGIAALAAAVVLAIVGRIRIWGMRLRPAQPSQTRPEGTIVFAAGITRGAHGETIPLLADWMARGVLRVERIGPTLPRNAATKTAWGPEWRFTILDPSSLSPIERDLLGAFVPGHLQPGDVRELPREDYLGRDALYLAVVRATQQQRAAFGVRQRKAPGAAFGLIALAVLGGAGSFVGAAFTNPAIAGVLFVPVVAGIGVVTALGRGGIVPTEAERRFRQQTRDLGAWVKTTGIPDPALAGWAMIWLLPGRWPDFVPEEIATLLGRDKAFLRGDWGRASAR
jgi:hypothetical protein